MKCVRGTVQDGRQKGVMAHRQALIGKLITRATAVESEVGHVSRFYLTNKESGGPRKEDEGYELPTDARYTECGSRLTGPRSVRDQSCELNSWAHETVGGRGVGVEGGAALSERGISCDSKVQALCLERCWPVGAGAR